MEDIKLKKMKEILYSNPKYKNMKIDYRIEEGNYYLIYHYQKNFNIFDMEFHELMSKIIEEVFYKNGITNVGQRDVLEREVKEYFPEKNEILNFYTALEFEEILNTLSKTFKKNIASNYTDTYFAINKYNNMKLNKRSKLNKTKYNKPNIIYSNFS
ncbi:hypothetical protein [Leptotrichia wadei]|uniref:Uncharacterized protein n=1 Tax=Leptotrichia wadei (strain F0279) TaxID=888055 RepID=U2RDP1_LEPWF|nr:hypothetical protein [Leptotrichia wadei]ERK51693.1 hypothetical protein HMPREF9015_01076 [Leptotrichia wadei F0279]